MAKNKAIKGFPAAIDCIKSLLGVKRMAAHVGKAERRVYFWLDEESEYIPSVRDCLTLDAAYIRAGGKFAPIFEAYREMLAAVADERPHGPEDFRASLAKAAFECGEAISVAIALGDDASAEDRRAALREVNEGIAALNELHRQLIASLAPDAEAR